MSDAPQTEPERDDGAGGRAEPLVGRRIVDVPPMPNPAALAELVAWEDDYIGQLCPRLSAADRGHFRPRGVTLVPKSRTNARILRVLRDDGWTWDKTMLCWRNRSAFP